MIAPRATNSSLKLRHIAGVIYFACIVLYSGCGKRTGTANGVSLDPMLAVSEINHLDLDFANKGFQRVWTREERYSRIAISPDGKTIIAIKEQTVDLLDPQGNDLKTLSMPTRQLDVRCARLSNQPSYDLLFLRWYLDVAAVGDDETILWTFSEEVRDVCASDLDNDGKDEVLCGTKDGLQILGNDGLQKWSAATETGVSQIVAGDLDGDGTAEVIGKSLLGFIHIFDASGTKLYTHYKDVHASLLATCRLPGESTDSVLAVEAGISRGAKMTVLRGNGEKLLESDFNVGKRHCHSLTIAKPSSWGAVSFDQCLCVFDMSSGKSLSLFHDEMLPVRITSCVSEDGPLLVVANRYALTAWRVPQFGGTP